MGRYDFLRRNAKIPVGLSTLPGLFGNIYKMGIKLILLERFY